MNSQFIARGLPGLLALTVLTTALGQGGPSAAQAAPRDAASAHVVVEHVRAEYLGVDRARLSYTLDNLGDSRSADLTIAGIVTSSRLEQHSQDSPADLFGFTRGGLDAHRYHAYVNDVTVKCGTLVTISSREGQQQAQPLPERSSEATVTVPCS